MIESKRSAMIGETRDLVGSRAAAMPPDPLGARPVFIKPLWRGWLHLVWFFASVIAGTLLIGLVDGGERTTAAAVYAASVTALFGTSALYHRGRWSPAAARRMQRLDHAMIFVLIAGSQTPFFVLVVPKPWGAVMLTLLWTLTAVAMVVHLSWMNAPEVLVGGTYIALGLIGIVALPYLFTHAGVAVFVLVLTGGVLYTAGAILFHLRWPDPRPAVFGFHEVFHSFVCVAAAAHYVAIGAVLA